MCLCLNDLFLRVGINNNGADNTYKRIKRICDPVNIDIVKIIVCEYLRNERKNYI